MDGVTGPVQFDEHGRRRVVAMDILNLRNNSFKVVSNQVRLSSHLIKRIPNIFFLRFACQN